MKRISLFTFFIFLGIAGCMAQASGEKIEKVYVAFKTHLDVGFTDLSSVVTERYVHDFIPKAIEVSERLRADGSGDRYVWTTGSWLIWKYLRTASPEAAKQLEEAIGRGDIVWNSVPYTVESETMTRELFETCLLLSKRLDKKYNKQTIAAKMTDVPGHTRSIIDPMYDAGIRLLHVGINSACPLPSVPTFCRWRSPSGNDLLLVYQKDYGEDEVLPDGKTVVSINFTGDNHGPHSYERVKKIYADLRKRYPQAQLVGASFNDVARELLLIKKDFHMFKEDHRAVIETSRRILEIQPDNDMVRNDLAEAYASIGDMNAANRIYSEMSRNDDDANEIKDHNEQRTQYKQTVPDMIKRYAERVLRRAYISKMTLSDPDLISSLDIDDATANSVLIYLSDISEYGDIVPGTLEFERMEKLSMNAITKGNCTDLDKDPIISIPCAYVAGGAKDADEAKLLVAYIYKVMTSRKSQRSVTPEIKKIIESTPKGSNVEDIVKRSKIGIYQAKIIKDNL